MGSCQVCGNVYDKTFTVYADDTLYTFDSIECAIRVVAPRCVRCGTAILGHGMEADGHMYCGAHCARHSGEHGLVDRARPGLPLTGRTDSIDPASSGGF